MSANMAASNTANPGMNWIYQAPQIMIPPQLPLVLKTYIKAAIRTQPRDLLSWSAYYFKCMHGGLVPPVKRHLEFPMFPATPWSFTPGCLHVLINQLGREGSVPLALLYEKWLGLTLNKHDLDRMLLLCHYPGKKMDIAELMAIAAGHLCQTLASTMTLVCELLTQEPEGGSAKVPLPVFSRLYQLLAGLDCGPAREDEIVVQDIILPFGAKESKLWSIPDGVAPDIRDFIKKHFEMGRSDVLDEEEEPDLESLTLSSCVDVPRTCPVKQETEDTSEESTKAKPTKSRKKRGPSTKLNDGEDQDSREGLQVWGDRCEKRGSPSESCSEESDPENHVEPKADDVLRDEAAKEKEVEDAQATDKEDKTDESNHAQLKEPFDLTSVPSPSSLPKIDLDCEEQPGSLRENENSGLYSGIDLAPSGLIGLGFPKVEGEDDSLTRSGEESQSRISLTEMGDILLRYHVPGIGPPLPAWQVEQVLDFMLQLSQRQEGFVMPRNIRHRNCPPLDLIEGAEGPEGSSYNSLKSRGNQAYD